MQTIAEQPVLNSAYCLEAAAMTACGPTREENQDAIVLMGQAAQKTDVFLEGKAQPNALFSVAVVDGMGGYQGGADAACIAAMTLSKYDLPCENPGEIDAFCNRLSDRILQAGHAWGTPAMGAAFAMLTIGRGMVTVANVGDCRVYRYDESENVLGLLSIDDRLANGRGGITQSLGGVAAMLDAHAFSESMRAGSQFLLCSDGVWGTLGDDVLTRVMRECDCASGAVHSIRRLCYQAKASDNCSAIVVKPVEQ